jgi:hypothetical protein
MSDDMDIVERLKTARDYYSFARPNDTVFRDAIAEITRLRATNAELVGSLRGLDEEIVALYAAASSGKRDVGERFAARSPHVIRARSALARP